MSKRELVLMVVMLFATTIGSLSVFAIGNIAKDVIEDLHLSYSLMGFVISIQRIVSTITSPFIGYFIDFVGPVKVLTVSMVISILSMILTPFSKDVGLLIITRIIAGAVFPAYWPSCTKITSLTISRNAIGLATALFESGSVVGIVVAYALIPVSSTWRSLFIMSSLFSLILIPIIITTLSKNVGIRYSSSKRGTLYLKDKEIVRIAIRIFFAFLFALLPWGFYTSWLSTYVIEKTGTKLKDIWFPVSIFLLIGMIFGIASSMLSDKIGGLKGRKIFLSLTLSITSATFFMMAIAGSEKLIWFFTAISIISFRAFLPLAWAIINDIVPQDLTGFISSVNALAAQVSMMITPIIVAYIRDVLGSFDISIILLSILVATSIPIYINLKPLSLQK